MKQLLFKLTGISLSVLLMMGCKRGDDPVPHPYPPASRMVKKLQVTETDFQSYQYTSDNKLTTYTSSWQSSPGKVSRVDFQFTYNANKLLKAATAGGWIDYHYNGIQITASDNFALTGRKLSTSDFTYDNQNRLIEIRETMEEPQDVTNSKFILTYKSDGNLFRMDYLVKRAGVEIYELIYSKLYEQYDNKRQPVPARIMEHSLPGLVLHKNNPLRVRTVLTGGSTSEILHITYQYDGEGYPVSRVQQIEINGNLLPTIQYNYQY